MNIGKPKPFLCGIKKNKMVYIVSDGTKERGKKIIDLLTYISGKDNNNPFKGNAKKRIYYYITTKGDVFNSPTPPIGYTEINL